jgi:hypothetical protein
MGIYDALQARYCRFPNYCDNPDMGVCTATFCSFPNYCDNPDMGVRTATFMSLAISGDACAKGEINLALRYCQINLLRRNMSHCRRDTLRHAQGKNLALRDCQMNYPHHTRRIFALGVAHRHKKRHKR